MRNDYLQAAQDIIQDPMILINVVSKRVKQLKFGERPFIYSLVKLEPEDVALREIIEGKISFELHGQNNSAPNSTPSNLSPHTSFSSLY
ncbi:MAG: DNA-directed RNA polymerase subunit omega [Puniceicoccales bacterium]|jgi:DNA-directed RNA polymerase subunit omega|nr:DNA-directed RNA polymerase subunit omega [Puniceicoccales bacterium]